MKTLLITCPECSKEDTLVPEKVDGEQKGNSALTLKGQFQVLKKVSTDIYVLYCVSCENICVNAPPEHDAWQYLKLYASISLESVLRINKELLTGPRVPELNNLQERIYRYIQTFSKICGEETGACVSCSRVVGFIPKKPDGDSVICPCCNFEQ